LHVYGTSKNDYENSLSIRRADRRNEADAVEIGEDYDISTVLKGQR
jgi:hypothetical protein